MTMNDASRPHFPAIRPEAWLLDRDVAYLNHGSFGACPRAVLERQQELRAEMEREPVEFLVRTADAAVGRVAPRRWPS